MKISLEDTEHFDAGDFKGNLYLDKKNNPDFTVLLIECVKGHFKMRQKRGTRVYFILEGEGTFEIDGKKTEVKPFDLVVIPRDTAFKYEGRMKIFECSIPATDEADEEKLEGQ